MAIGSSTQAFANSTDHTITPDTKLEPITPTSLESSISTDTVSTITIDADFFQQDSIKLDIPNQRSGYQLNGTNGTVTGELTLDDPWDYYVFEKNTNFYTHAFFKTNDSAYTMTLGIADYTTGQISLSDIVLHLETLI